MKHTDFFKKTRAIKAEELRELTAALEAHGGSYEWGEDDEKPIIAVNPNWLLPSPIDIEITEVNIENENIQLYGVEKEYGEPISLGGECAFAGHLSSIIDYIPETEEIKDVSIPQEYFKISSLSRDDLEHIGFCTDNMDDNDMEEEEIDEKEEYLDYIDDMADRAMDDKKLSINN